VLAPVFGVQKVRSAGEARERMAAEVRAGLEAEVPYLPSKYFYDDLGSRLFEEITELPEYYQTRTETAILERAAGGIIADLHPRELVELGAGTSPKVRLILDAMVAHGGRACTLFDVHAPSLEASLTNLRAAYPGLDLRGIAGDFSTDVAVLGSAPGRLVAFLGSTIGNFHPDEATRFFEDIASILQPGGALLLGVDLVKDVARVEAAYNDARGVTAAFNRNILSVVNDCLDGDFVPQEFGHVAFYDRRHAWIEMRLRALRKQTAHVRAIGVTLELQEGDEIRTEISCKYTRASLEALLPRTLATSGWHQDPEALFALAVLERRG
jgi:L-histidine Nalpha-methyltransferase